MNLLFLTANDDSAQIMLLKCYAILLLMASLMKRTAQKTSKGTISKKCAKVIQKAIKAYGFEMVEQFLDSESTQQEGVLELTVGRTSFSFAHH